MRAPRISWARLSDEQLLQLRMCDLRLDLHRSPIKRHVERLYSELETNAASASGPMSGWPKSGFHPTGYRASPYRFTWRTRV